MDARFTGRNDIVAADGRKFSGNAFRLSRETGLHHGTLLVDVDMDKLSRYLAPSKEKLAAKGIESVRSRVVNLSELAPVTVPALREALKQAFLKEYGECGVLTEEELDRDKLDALYKKHSSWEWRLGATPAFDIELNERFEWGELQLLISAKDGMITDVTAYSDAMDTELVDSIAPALRGVRFESKRMADAVRAPGGCARDIADWLEKKEF